MRRKPTLPSRVRIKRDITYDIVYSDDLGADTIAECRPEPLRQIAIKNNLSNKELIKSFLHELLHAIEFEHDLKISHSLVHELEEPIYKVLILNGWIKK